MSDGLTRYARPYCESPEILDGLPNFFAAVRILGAGNKPLLEAGINALKSIKGVDGSRRTARLISSNPNEVGSEWTPWDDTPELDASYKGRLSARRPEEILFD